jgi:hypothetical protein
MRPLADRPWRLLASVAVALAALASAPATAASLGSSPRPTASTFTVIAPEDPGFALDLRFGSSVALRGDDLYIGAAGDGAEALYHYRFDGGTWNRLQIIEGDVDAFGQTMVLDADRLAVGMEGQIAFYDVSTGSPVFERMLTDDAPWFGTVFDLSGDWLAVRAQDGVHMFSWSGAAWVRQEIVVPADDREVTNLALQGEWLALSNAYYGPGTVWVYLRDASTWTLDATLEPPIGGDHDYGKGLAFDGERLAVGRQGGTHVEIFERDAGTWTIRDEITSLYVSGAFATHLILDGERLLVADGAGNSELWRRDPDGLWIRQMGLGTSSDLAMEGMRLVLTHPGLENVNGTKVGQVVVVDVAGAWSGGDCSTAEDCAGTACVSGKCCNESCNHTCEVCSAELGSERDGICVDTRGPECCTYASDCGEDTFCRFHSCDDDNTCHVEDLCCASDSDCEPDPDPSCVVTCPSGRCTRECEPEPTTGSSTDGGATGPSTGGSAGAGEGAASGGCGCRSHGGGTEAVWLLLALAWRRRR